jgi:hypothetical protein
MTYTAHFHGGPWDGQTREFDGDPQAELYVPGDPLPVDEPEVIKEVSEIPTPHRVPRYEVQADESAHYDWTT